MLPLYISYFVGDEGGGSRRKIFTNVSGFILGFTIIFVLLGALAGAMGSLLAVHQGLLNIITGGAVILIGMFYMGIFRIKPMGRGLHLRTQNVRITGFVSALVFGLVFGLAWTPCIGPVLAALLVISANQGSAGSGVLLLLFYSAGLAIPFLLSTLFLDNLKGAFDFVKRNFSVFRRVSGSVLVLVGVLMSTGHMHQLLLFVAN